MTIPNPRTLAYLGLATTFLLWSGNNVIARAAANDIAPIALSFWRWVTALIVMLPFTWKSVYRERAIINAHRKALIGLSILGIAGFNVLLYSAASTTTAINISLVAQLLPIATILMAWILLKERPLAQQLLGILVAMVGVMIIISQGSLSVFRTVSFNYGDLMIFWGVTVIGLYAVLLRYYSLPLSTPVLLTVLFAIAIVVLLPFYLWERTIYGDFALSTGNMSAILYVGIFSSAVGNIFFNNGIAVVGPSTATMFSYLQPLFTTLLAVPLLGEALTEVHIAGGLLIIVGVFFAAIYRPTPATAV